MGEIQRGGFRGGRGGGFRGGRGGSGGGLDRGGRGGFRGGRGGGGSDRGGRGGFRGGRGGSGGGSDRGGRGGFRGGFRGGRGGGGSDRGGRGGFRNGGRDGFRNGGKDNEDSFKKSEENNNNQATAIKKTNNKRSADDLDDNIDTTWKKQKFEVDPNNEFENTSDIETEGGDDKKATKKQPKPPRKTPKQKNLGDLDPSIEFMSKENQAIMFTRKNAEFLKLNTSNATSFKESHFIEPKADIEDLSNFIKSIHPLLHTYPDRKKYKVQNGAPLVIIATCSATRAIGISKVLSEFNIFTKVGLYFAKHKKIEEHTEVLNNYPVRIIVGTPNRLLKLVENGSLKLKGSVLVQGDKKQQAQNALIETDEETRYLIIDKSFKTLKGEDLFRISGTDLFEFFDKSCKELVLSGKMKVSIV
ncbi:hypothetical protein DDB_G0280257 [Dictyostelium discoideum AX4]|uniref:Uncharacterized protein n=1 Tax=Dictyostelium discoideum TaxID=44689 RepID=Q54VM1_DICDI|nr:hypothetical protein DDB_G0280257 [Dictyostelium discoideum AX4]EAL67355.1 hypothetical protein DDB_G0280257 [Dictyostelium discoideum AX4]|eukprot:XP_641334.1 hypothetical protein DDB_G0280257 [Dictyostelium discoideum AX4]